MWLAYVYDDIVVGVGEAIGAARIEFDLVARLFEIVGIAPWIVGYFVDDLAVIGGVDEVFEALGEFFVVESIGFAIAFEALELCFSEAVICSIGSTHDVVADEPHNGDHQRDDDHDFDERHAFAQSRRFLRREDAFYPFYSHKFVLHLVRNSTPILRREPLLA